LASRANKVNRSLFQQKRLQSARQQREGLEMNLTPPTTVVFIISLILAALAVIAALGVNIPFVSEHTAWTAIVAYVVLAIGNLFRGL
jgi:biopolymer transport protein ExbD